MQRVIDAADEPKPEEVTYSSLPALKETMHLYFGKELVVPNLQQADLGLLDNAITLLTPPVAQVRVMEVDTFMESERSIVRGPVPVGESNYTLRQISIILRRIPGVSDEEVAEAGEANVIAGKPSKADTAEGADAKTEGPVDTVKDALDEAAPAVAAATANEGGAAEDDGKWRELPEIILFWARSRRSGGNLVVCPEHSMNRLVQAYLVSEIVEHSQINEEGGLIPERDGALMGVELGESLPSEQAALDNLISDYSFHDASIGVVSLAASIYYFGVLGRNDVNVLTLLAVAVVAGLNQEATWPWVFKLVLHCARIKDPIVRVAQCRRVHHFQGQLSGQGFLAIGLAVFGVYLEVVPWDDGDTPLYFRIFLNVFQGGMLVVLVLNMIQAVEPMADGDKRTGDRLRPWARTYLEDKVFDTVWYLTLLVMVVWAGVIVAVLTGLSYEGDSRGWHIFIACLVVFSVSVMTINPGMALLSVWGLVWMIPAGFAFVLRSAFDICTLLINRVQLTSRRFSREVRSHARDSSAGFSVKKMLILIPQCLPLLPLLLLSLFVPLLHFLAGVLHLTLRFFLAVSDVIIYPVTPFRLYNLLSDYGSVTWKMSRLSLDVENSSMRALLKKRVSKLLATDGLGELVKAGVLPCKPYAHLKATTAPRLGCISVVLREDGERALHVNDVLEKGRTNSTDSNTSAAGEAMAGYLASPVPVARKD